MPFYKQANTFFSSLGKKTTSTSTLLFTISHKKIFTKKYLLVSLSLLSVDISTYLHLVFIPTQKHYFHQSHFLLV